MSALRLPGRILALTPGDLDPARLREFLARARAAVGAGLDAILLREPAFSDREVLQLAGELRVLLGAGGWLGIHDRAHLAAAAEADGVQVGFRSIPPRAARRILPSGVALGFSAHAHDPDGARDGADFLVFGPVHATASKRGILAPAGLEGLRATIAHEARPVLSLGGLDATNAAEALAAGAHGVAVRGAIFGAPDPAAATLRLRAAVGIVAPR